MKLEIMARELGVLLKRRTETVAISESSTGGLISAALLSIPGASAYYLGGGVIYTGCARRALLDLPAELPAETRSASEAYASLCARTIRDKLGATWGLAETGATGPSGNRYGDAAGHCCLAVAGPAEMVITLETGHGDREANMWAFAGAGLALLTKAIETVDNAAARPTR
jgi:PncC family amidohydrolase